MVLLFYLEITCSVGFFIFSSCDDTLRKWSQRLVIFTDINFVTFFCIICFYLLKSNTKGFSSDFLFFDTHVGMQERDIRDSIFLKFFLQLLNTVYSFDKVFYNLLDDYGLSVVSILEASSCKLLNLLLWYFAKY